jgi:redox-sensitive bicupin YhaK (pirin superfamily)
MIVQRTRGQKHGPITRLMSPGDLGEHVKPFVFLDYFELGNFQGKGFAPHPHSGIATHTTLLSGATNYGDSTGGAGVLPENGLEWMQAGGGVWHWGNPRTGGPVRGYQLWIALPQAMELAAPQSEYLAPERVPVSGSARVLLGRYEEQVSPIPYDEPLTYLHVRLRHGESWRFVAPKAHDVSWLATHVGKLRIGGETVEREMVVFAEGTREVLVEAEGEAELVFGSSMKHPHPLVCGYYSVHTSEEALEAGEAGITRALNAMTQDAIRKHRAA